MTRKSLTLFRWFLRENPQWIPDVRHAVVGGTPEVCFTTDLALALTEWQLRTRRGDQAQARRIREQLRREFGK